MKKYKLLKKLETENSFEIWTIFDIKTITANWTAFINLDDWSCISADFLIREWYIEEVQYENPKFKIWDYIFLDKNFTDYTRLEYSKIHTISKWVDDIYYYNWYREDKIRLMDEFEKNIFITK